MVWKPINHVHWLFLQVLGLIILLFFYLIEWKLCFVGMNVVMGQKTIVKTPTTWSQSSTVIWPTFPSRGFTHDQMCWKSFFTIKLTFEPMKILFMVHVTKVHITDVSICSTHVTFQFVFPFVFKYVFFHVLLNLKHMWSLLE
jgi:hypothetical protein